MCQMHTIKGFKFHLNCDNNLSKLNVSSVQASKNIWSITKIICINNGAMGHWIDPSKWIHWAISHYSQCSTTGVTKAVVCVILSVGWYI